MTRAVLFDFGGTLYDYRCFARAEAESLSQLVRWAGSDAGPDAIARAQRAASKQVFESYRERPFYLHRDLFDDTSHAVLAELGVRADADTLERYRKLRWDLHARDFALRPGVRETLDGLRARGLHIGMVSNIDDDQLDHLLAIASVRSHFDAVLSSERARSCKPAPDIFRQALASAGCAPGEAIFVGDSLFHDVGGANALGLRSVLIWHREDREPPAQGPRPQHVIRRFDELLEIAR
ncbi:MAG TPA: HAD family hydrolase [Myxococcota bacterium]|nr:HAD family hydrolase [Myxococcota bacterium]